jgi:flagellar basal-body rod protein FlgG
MILRSFESASKGMLGLVDMLDSTANNLANVNTVGFKKEQLTFQNIYDATVTQNEGTLLDGTTRNLGNLSMGSQVQKLTYDFSQGSLQKTGNVLDVAIEGDGFLKIQSPEGDMAYTRNGSLTLDSNSFLVTREGDFVLDPEDQRIQINMRDVIFDNFNKITISEKGHIEVNHGLQKVQLQQIAVYDFQNKESMFRMGDSKFISTDNENNPPVVAEKFTIQQGMLEMSNSNVIREMLSTINTSRNYESLQKHVKTSGQMLSQAISVGKIKS